MSPTLSPTIHLIDDDAAVRESLALLIGTVGLRVITWADPQDFLSGFDREAIGAIVLDVRMPGISGLTVLDTLVAQGVDCGERIIGPGSGGQDPQRPSAGLHPGRGDPLRRPGRLWFRSRGEEAGPPPDRRQAVHRPGR